MANNEVSKATSFHPVTHIIFDCDGLLVDSEKYYSEALSVVASRYGKQFDYKIKLDMMGELIVSSRSLVSSWIV